ALVVLLRPRRQRHGERAQERQRKCAGQAGPSLQPSIALHLVFPFPDSCACPEGTRRAFAAGARHFPASAAAGATSVITTLRWSRTRNFFAASWTSSAVTASNLSCMVLMRSGSLK